MNAELSRPDGLATVQRVVNRHSRELYAGPDNARERSAYTVCLRPDGLRRQFSVHCAD